MSGTHDVSRLVIQVRGELLMRRNPAPRVRCCQRQSPASYTEPTHTAVGCPEPGRARFLRPPIHTQQEKSMTTYKVGYFIGSLAKNSINRQLAKALIKVAPAQLTFTEIAIKDLP